MLQLVYDLPLVVMLQLVNDLLLASNAPPGCSVSPTLQEDISIFWVSSRPHTNLTIYLGRFYLYVFRVLPTTVSSI